MTEDNGKPEAEWLNQKDNLPQLLISWDQWLLMEILDSEEQPQSWKWWNYSLKPELLVFILKIKDLEPKNADIWPEKLLFQPKNIAKDYKLLDYKLISWEVKSYL